MSSRNIEFLGLIDRAVAAANAHGANATRGVDPKLLTALQSLKGKIESGQLEPSGGVITLGLTRHLADTADALASPLLQAIGEVERFYRENFKD